MPDRLTALGLLEEERVTTSELVGRQYLLFISDDPILVISARIFMDAHHLCRLSLLFCGNGISMGKQKIKYAFFKIYFIGHMFLTFTGVCFRL